MESMQKIFNPTNSIEDIDTIILDFYQHDTEGEFVEEEFYPVTLSITGGLTNYYQYRMNELDATYTQDQIHDSIYQAIFSSYPNINDFIVEYKQFAEWHKNGENIYEQKGFSFWIGVLFEHGKDIRYLNVFLDAKKNIKERGVENGIYNFEIIKTLTEIAKKQLN